MTSYLPRLRLQIVAVIVIAATFGTVRSQNVPQPSNPELKPAFELLSQRRNEEALKLVRRVIKQNEANAEAWYFLGIVHLQRGDLTKASTAFDKACVIQPNLAAEAHSRLAYSAVLRDRLPDAVRAARKALEVDPNTTSALYTLGLVNLRNRARDEALKHADAIIALNPEFALAHLLKSEASMIWTTGDRSPDPFETKRKQALRYREAAAALEGYVKLLDGREDAKFWKEQLKTLAFYTSQEPAEVYSGSEVTARAKLVSKPEPSYTEDARRDGIQGTVILRAVFAADGRIKQVLVLQSLPGGLTETCVTAAKSIKFEPATINGTPVSLWMQLEYNFNLF